VACEAKRVAHPWVKVKCVKIRLWHYTCLHSQSLFFAGAFVKSLPWPLDIHGSKLSIYRNIFLSQYREQKYLVCIGPYTHNRYFLQVLLWQATTNSISENSFGLFIDQPVKWNANENYSFIFFKRLKKQKQKLFPERVNWLDVKLKSNSSDWSIVSFPIYKL